MRSVAVGMVVLAVAATLGKAALLDPKQIPAEAKWVLHVDVDGLKQSTIGKAVLSELEKKADFQQTLQNVEQWAGVKLPQDLQGATLYGTSLDGQGAVMLIRGKIDPARITTLLQTISGLNSSKHGEHDIYAWQDNGKQLYGSLHPSALVISGGAQENVAAALDLLNGKGEAVKGGSKMMAGAQAGSLVYLAGDGLSELKQAKTPLANQVQTAWLSLREQGDQLVLNAAATAKTPQFAEQIRASLEGIRAMLTLAASGENADPTAKAASTALQMLSVKTQGNTLAAECRVPIDLVRTVLQNAQINAAANEEQDDAADVKAAQ